MSQHDCIITTEVVTHDQIRAICAKLPGSVEGEERFGFGVPRKGKIKGYCWSWRERVDPKKPKVINDSVLAVMVPNLSTKDMLLASDTVNLFTEPHYNNYPAVLIRLDVISEAEVEELLIEAWKCVAGKDLLTAYATVGE
ncbi:MAG: hypothetical protein JSS72_10975 [Armatimonadetes bacterium]|nr:hypothetical protein [Armatimonadota bacterium]